MRRGFAHHTLHGFCWLGLLRGSPTGVPPFCSHAACCFLGVPAQAVVVHCCGRFFQSSLARLWCQTPGIRRRRQATSSRSWFRRFFRGRWSVRSFPRHDRPGLRTPPRGFRRRLLLPYCWSTTSTFQGRTRVQVFAHHPLGERRAFGLDHTSPQSPDRLLPGLTPPSRNTKSAARARYSSFPSACAGLTVTPPMAWSEYPEAPLPLVAASRSPSRVRRYSGKALGQHVSQKASQAISPCGSSS